MKHFIIFVNEVCFFIANGVLYQKHLLNRIKCQISLPLTTLDIYFINYLCQGLKRCMQRVIIFVNEVDCLVAYSTLYQTPLHQHAKLPVPEPQAMREVHHYFCR